MALQESSISFIGGGVMAEAMIAGLLRQQLIAPERITASNPRRQRGESLRQRHGIATTTDNLEAANAGEIVVLAVKPQVLGDVLRELEGRLTRAQLVLSIVAGATIPAIARGLLHPSVVRAMPNTPAQIGHGMTVWTASDEVEEPRRTQARALLGALGQEIFVEDERFIDMATALSGTGPAYVFLFMEALIDAGVHLGFPRRIAEQLVIETVLGSASFARDSGKHLAELRNMVTSPSGTSAEAIYQLEKGSLRTVLSRGVWAAYQRSRSLGDRSRESS